MTSLKEGRCKRWSEEMAALDFTHSSRRAWSLLRKLGGATHSKRQQPEVTANEVAHQLLLNGSVKKDRKQAKHILKQQREALSDCPETSNLSQAFTTDEIINALKATKAGKAAGPDGIFPDMLKNIGPAAIRWLQAFYDDVVTTANIPKIWRSANVIAIRKPGKPLNDPTSYRPISLLCCCYKLLERLLLTRLAPIFESVIPPEQAGFRKKRNTCDQVLALTSYIESGFQKKLKTGAVLIDLSAAYDTVWQAGLMMKLSKAIKCRTTIRLIASLISQRNFRVFLGSQVSRKRMLKNGLPQGSVLAPSFFNVYISDLPPTESLKFGYADDWTLATQSNTFSHLESTLSLDIEHLNEYFDYWKLRLNAKKTVATCFHLDNKQATRKLKVTLAGDVLVHDYAPKYLGVTLDRSLTYKKHTENVRDNVKSRCNIISKLAGTNWGCTSSCIRTATSAIALLYSVAEYCVPVWGRCAHVQHVDTQLNIAMRTVSGALRPTNINWLPVLSNIEPPQIRRGRATLQEHKKDHQLTDCVPIKEILREPTMSRLRSRRPFEAEAARLASLNQTEQQTWEQSWIEGVPPGHDK